MRWAVAVLLLLLSGCASAQPPAEDPCYYDREMPLALDYEAFVNDPDGGWRALANEAGCESKAADLVEAYRVENATTSFQTMGLVHHEAQLRAAAGETRRAVSLLRTLLPIRTDDPAMLAYHRAEIAFLRGDRPGLEVARSDLAALAASHPVNLDVVDGFLNCFGRPYGEAYSDACRP